MTSERPCCAAVAAATAVVVAAAAVAAAAAVVAAAAAVAAAASPAEIVEIPPASAAIRVRSPAVSLQARSASRTRCPWLASRRWLGLGLGSGLGVWLG